MRVEEAFKVKGGGGKNRDVVVSSGLPLEPSSRGLSPPWSPGPCPYPKCTLSSDSSR